MKKVSFPTSPVLLFSVLCLLPPGALRAYQFSGGDETATSGDDPAISAISPTKERGPETFLQNQSVDWSRVFQQSARFLAIQHGFRLATEKGTRQGMRGPFFDTYAESIRSMHGWADGDPFYVNFIGHPMMGAVAGRIFEQNDRRYLGASFGNNRDYWKRQLRAAAFSFAYSAQFEIGPFSEASIGKIQRTWPQHGFVDFVVTPVIGMGWAIGEDAIDEYLVRRIERWTGNNYARILARGWLNPARSFANMLAGRVPWYREDRAGVYAPYSYVRRERAVDPAPAQSLDTPSGLAPFEFSMNFEPQYFTSAAVSCFGGNGSAAFRLAPQWQLVFEAGGCKMSNLPENLSGDSLTYMAGPRWRPSPNRRFRPHLQLLVGGHKVAQERFFPDKWQTWEPVVTTVPNPAAYRYNYTDRYDSNAFALAAGGGLDIRLNNALAFRLASLQYRHSWVQSLDGLSFQNGLQFSTGLVLQMGTW
ncbi:MAG: hypothetical protein JST93_17265 [Acidobacteria bacterium]|nr:hypothetical protein [Acidobacteriota bacterium]